MSRNGLVWNVGQATIGTAVRTLAPLRVYGAERVPEDGGVVLVFNHFSWLDPPAFGAASPRQLYFLAKAELHDVPVMGPLIKAFGTYSVRRGESDREAVREMRRCVHEGNALGHVRRRYATTVGRPRRREARRGDGRAQRAGTGCLRSDPRQPALAARQLPPRLGRLGPAASHSRG